MFTQYINTDQDILMIAQVITLCFISIFIGLSQTAGIGGGPIINVCLMLSNYFNQSGASGSFSSKNSISITYLFIIGGSIASIWKNSQKNNSKTKKSYANTDLIMLTMPLMSAGSMAGSILKNLLSELITLLLFLTVFGFLISQTYKKLQQIMKKDEKDNKINPQNKNNQSESMIKQIKSNKVKQTQNYIRIFTQYKIFWLVFQFVGLYLLTFGMILLRGDTNYSSAIGISQCSWPAFIIFIVYVGVCFCVMWVLITLMKKSRDINTGSSIQISQIPQASTRTTIQSNNLSEQKQSYKRINESDKIHEISLEYSTIKSILIGGFLAGAVGATLGIGGAPILIPIWLKSGIDHNVAANSTATLILSSSLIAFTISALNKSYNQISPTQIVFYLVLAFISSALVKDLLTHFAQKYQLKYLVLVLLMAIFLLSLLLLIPIEIITMMDDMDSYIRFGNVC